MPMVDLRAMADRPVVFYAAFGRIAGGAANGLFLAQAWYWSARTQDGWFWKTRDAWERETTLTRREQERARARLRALGLLQEERRGVPARMYYRIDGDRLAELLTADATREPDPEDLDDDGEADPAPTSRYETRQPVGAKRTSQLAQNVPTGWNKTRQLYKEELYEDLYEDQETAKSLGAPPSAQPSPPTGRDAPQAPPTASPAPRDDGQLSLTALEPNSNAWRIAQAPEPWPESPQDAPEGLGSSNAPGNARSSHRRAQGANEDDVLAPYPALLSYYPQLWASIREANPHVKPPKPGSQADRKARDALAKLVRIDGYPESDVVGLLEWVFEATDERAEFWRQNVLSPCSLRVSRNGASKFAKIWAQWKQRGARNLTEVQPDWAETMWQERPKRGEKAHG